MAIPIITVSVLYEDLNTINWYQSMEKGVNLWLANSLEILPLVFRHPRGTVGYVYTIVPPVKFAENTPLIRAVTTSLSTFAWTKLSSPNQYHAATLGRVFSILALTENCAQDMLIQVALGLLK